MQPHLPPWLRSLRNWQHQVRFRPAFPFVESAFDYVESLENSLRFAWTDDLVEHIETFLPSEAVEYPLPPNAPRGFVQRHAFPDAWFAVLRDVNVSPNSGLAWRTRPNKVLVETVGELRPALISRREPARGQPIDLAVVAALGVNAFHFFIEVAPLLAHVKRAGFRPSIVVPLGSLPFVEEAIRVLFGSDAVILRPSSTFRATRLLAARRDAPAGIVRPGSARLAREAFLATLPPERMPTGPEHVYVTRRGARARRIENEDELEAYLVSLGFTPVELAGLAFADQVAAFRNARTIVGLHGAGLTHMHWAREGARIIELFPRSEKNGNNCYATMSSALGFSYDFAFLKPSVLNPHGRFEPSILDGLLLPDVNRAHSS